MTRAMTMPVLVLNASYEPVNITRARRAVVMLVKGVAVIEEAHDLYVHVGLQLPCVLRLRQYRRVPARIQTLSRKNILIRDGHTCQYCGEKFLSCELELEHVIPRAQGGLSTWENLVAAATHDVHFVAPLPQRGCRVNGSYTRLMAPKNGTGNAPNSGGESLIAVVIAAIAVSLSSGRNGFVRKCATGAERNPAP